MPAPEEVYRDALKRLAEDRARFGSTNYVKYRVRPLYQCCSYPESPEFTAIVGTKSRPYSNKINAVSNQAPQGLSPENINAILDNLRYGQQRSSAATIGVLGNQFKKSYEPRIENAVARNMKDIKRGVGEAEGQIGISVQNWK